MTGRALIVAAALATAGCAATSRNGEGTGWARVDGVPFVRQTSQQGCGAAALAMVLNHLGRRVTQDEIWAAAPPPPGQGLPAGALRDFARTQGLEVYLVEGRPGDLERELDRGRPVLVGVMKREGRRVLPHYQVVVGVDRRRARVLLLDPARGRRETSLEKFAAEWEAAGRVTLVVRPPRAPVVVPASSPEPPVPATPRASAGQAETPR